MFDCAQDEGPSGLRGWLLVPTVGLVIGLAIQARYVVRYTLAAYRASVNPAAPHGPWLELYRFFTYAVEMGLFLGGVLLLAQLLLRSRRVPQLIPIWFAACFLSGLAGALLAAKVYVSGAVPSGSRIGWVPSMRIVQSLVSGAIWIPYFRLSRRVKNTFVR